MKRLFDVLATAILEIFLIALILAIVGSIIWAIMETFVVGIIIAVAIPVIWAAERKTRDMRE